MNLCKGEILCPDCKGKRYSLETDTLDNTHSITRNQKCLKCNGEGKLDWVENLIGKDNTKTITGLCTIDNKETNKFLEKIYGNMSKKIAEDIDNEIINLIKNNK